MKRTIAGLLLLAVLVASCLPFGFTAHDTGPVRKLVCTAHYTAILPNTAVGTDSCGNRWLLQDGHCWYYLHDQGTVVEINCPAEGDTTYSEK